MKQFWHQLKSWLETHVNVSFQKDDRTILFSFQGTNELINYLHVLSKYHIYKDKCSNKRLHIQGFRILLKQKLRSEKYIASIYGRLDHFFKKWLPIYNYFETQNAI